MEFALFAHVAFDLAVDQIFTYRVPAELEPLVQSGSRVLAPFGRRKITGFVVSLSERSEVADPSPIADALDPMPVFSESLLSLAKWIAEYYITPLGQVLGAMLPPGLERHGETLYRLKQVVGEYEIRSLTRTKPVQAKILKALYIHKKLTLRQLIKKVGARMLARNLEELQKLGIVGEFDVISEQEARVRTEKWVRLSSALVADPERIAAALEAIFKRSPKQHEVLSFLSEKSESENEVFEIRQSELLQATDAPLSAVKSLLEKNHIDIFEREKIRDPYELDVPKPKAIVLNAYQASAVESVAQAVTHGKFHAFLLHGITGSGKTQVYIESIKKALDSGKSAIVLVPEIALTPQAVERFRACFEGQVAVLHSRMSIGERFDSWRKLQSGAVKIAIGARSAIFAPVPNLGLIVVDEEHEHTYKQTEPAPRYHARDAAVVRAHQSGAVVILGSATPSMETYYNAKSGKYTLLTLPERIDGVPLPEVEIVSMRGEYEAHTSNWEPILSRALRNRMKHAIQHKQQVILFQNRRGYASYVECYDCGFVAECPRCSVTLTYHISNHKLQCHYCGYKIPVHTACPKCENLNILHQGIGTQKVEEQIRTAFPDAGVLRMDLDTTTGRGAHEKMLNRFRDREALILLGTQMVTKGLDFENVTVVGVISADTSLLLPDFRSHERTFQMLTQVAGRAGRKEKPGHVVIQTMHPERSAILHAQGHAYEAFYEEEIVNRRELGYPPFGRLALIQIRAEEEQKAIDQSVRISDILQRVMAARRWGPPWLEILGPAPAPMAKLRNYYRYHILIKAGRQFDKSGSYTRELIQTTLQEAKSFSDGQVHVSVDVDPVTVL